MYIHIYIYIHSRKQRKLFAYTEHSQSAKLVPSPSLFKTRDRKLLQEGRLVGPRIPDLKLCVYMCYVTFSAAK